MWWTENGYKHGRYQANYISNCTKCECYDTQFKIQKKLNLYKKEHWRNKDKTNAFNFHILHWSKSVAIKEPFTYSIQEIHLTVKTG